MSTSTIPMWGQAWKLTVMYADGPPVVVSSSAWEPEALRITFEVLQCAIGHPWWFADIRVYNLNEPAIQNALFNAIWCRLEAGFQTGPNRSSVIWDGPILQVLYGRENVVDQYITLHCVANPITMNSIITFSSGPFSSQQHMVATMAAAIGLPPLDPANGNQTVTANQMMSAKQFPRGKTVFGKVGKYLQQLADDNLMTTFRDGTQAYIGELSNPNLTPQITYCPPLQPGVANPNLPPGVTASIVGTPQQSPFGVVFEVLLDPRLKVQMPVQVVALDRATAITQIPVIPAAGSQVVTPYTSNLSFFVSQVRHVGDSRGNNWQTEVVGYSTTYADQLNVIFASQSIGAG